GGGDTGQASAFETPLRQPQGVREHRIVIAVLPTVLKTPQAWAVQSLLAGGLVRVIDRLVLQELIPRLPAHDSRLVDERTQNRVPRRVRSIGAGLLLDCA